MPNDVITLNAISKELNTLLTRGKIEKIYQPENDELTFSIKNNGTPYILTISANANLPRIHITSQKKENPLSASTFCMLMRKHLSSGIIEDISLINADRIIKIVIASRNEMGDNVKFFLIAELMGRYSNIILTTDDFVILDAIKKVYFEQSSRPILPNLKYQGIENTKITLDDNEKLALLLKENIPTEELLLSNISGFAKETAKEIIARNTPIIDTISTFYNINDTDTYLPCIRYDNENNIKDFYITPYQTLKGTYERCDTLNACLDKFYLEKDTEIRKKNNTREVSKLLKRLKTKTERRIEDNNNKLIECESLEIYKQYGELILTNIYKLKKGDKKLICTNFYDNSTAEIDIDEQLQPNQNAQRYFKKYHKLKRAKEISKEQLENLNIQQDYLLSIESSINNSTTKQEYEEIFDELRILGNIKEVSQNKKSKKQKLSSPLHINIDGFDIYVGKNNLQNEEVTFNIASKGDVWMHTKGYHGSHTVIKGENPPENVIQKAAEICAYFSEGRESSKVEVDYTEKKNVKRHKSGMTGMVFYVNFKTIVVVPKKP